MMSSCDECLIEILRLLYLELLGDLIKHCLFLLVHQRYINHVLELIYLHVLDFSQHRHVPIDYEIEALSLFPLLEYHISYTQPRIKTKYQIPGMNSCTVVCFVKRLAKCSSLDCMMGI